MAEKKFVSLERLQEYDALIKEKFDAKLAESIPDWNQGDEGAPNYVKNRTHYEKIVEKTIVSNEEMTGTSVALNASLFSGAEDQVKFILDGTEYICASTISGSTINFGGGEVPVTLSVAVPDTATLTFKEDKTHLVTIIAYDVEIKPLDEKYMPESIILKTGKNVANITYVIDGTEVTASSGAEIFNDYNANIATGSYSHAEGYTTIASGAVAHAEGSNTVASGNYAHAEGSKCQATSTAAHAEGNTTQATANGAHAEGYNTKALYQTAHAEGFSSTANQNAAHAEGHTTLSTGIASHAEGYKSEATDKYTHAEGYSTKATYSSAHAEGYLTIAENQAAHAEGHTTVSSNIASHAEGYKTEASGKYAHAEGEEAIASGWAAHAEGESTEASGDDSHAEGCRTIAGGEYAHAEGYETEASGEKSHAEGDNSKAEGEASHAEGYVCVVNGYAAHGEGFHTIATADNSHVQGKYNIEDTSNTYAHIVGNGTANASRSNAHTIDWNGNAWFSGDVYINSTGGTNKDDGSLKLATEGYADAVAAAVKNELLDGAGDAYDTLKELGELIDENHDTIDALEIVATGKADKEHEHSIENVTGLQTVIGDLQAAIDEIQEITAEEIVAMFA